MDAILQMLNAWRQGTEFTPTTSILLISACFMLVRLAVVRAEDVLADIRAALRHAGISDKAAAVDFGVSKGNCSDKLSGERPLTIQTLAKLPEDFWQWFYILGHRRVGAPELLLTGAHLHRQARMTLPTHVESEEQSA